MITWIQRYFQHHFRIIFGVLLFVTIVSFVLIYSPSSGIGRAERHVTSRPFFGLNLASQEDQRRLGGDAMLSVNLQAGYMALEGAQMEEYALNRRAALYLANQLHVPAPTTVELTDFLKTMRAFAGEDGQFDAKRYAAFRDSLKTSPRLTEADVSRVLTEDWRGQKVRKLLGGPGYVLPRDILNQLTRAESSWTIAVSTLDYASFSPAIKPSEAELTKFFEENSFRYEIPSRVGVTYVDFPAANFVSQVKLTDDEIKAYYDANPTRFTPPVAAKDPKEKKADPAAEFATARPQVVAALTMERAQRLATKAASDLSIALYDGKVAASGVDAFLATRKLTAKKLAPFTREAGPAEFPGAPELANEAFKLDANRFFSDALPTATSAVVLFWQETLPSRKSLFAEVRSSVLADYVENEKRKQFVEYGKRIHAQIETRLKAGETFEKAVAAVTSGTVKAETKTFAPFTLRQPPQDLDYSILGALERLNRGQVSDLIIAKDKGYLVQAVEKKMPNLSESSEQYTTTKTQLAGSIANFNSNSYLSELVAQELKKSEPAAP